jgi:hypothetical protein
MKGISLPHLEENRWREFKREQEGGGGGEETLRACSQQKRGKEEGEKLSHPVKTPTLTVPVIFGLRRLQGPKSNQPQGYEIRQVAFHTSEDKQALLFTASAPQRYTFEGHPEAQSPSTSSSSPSPSGFPLSWKVHKKTGRLLEVQNMKEILDHFSANDQEADDAGRRDSFAVTPVDSLELAEAKDNLRDSAKEHVEGMVRNLWDALAEAWLPHRQGFASDGADIIHKVGFPSPFSCKCGSGGRERERESRSCSISCFVFFLERKRSESEKKREEEIPEKENRSSGAGNRFTSPPTIFIFNPTKK